MADFRHIQLLLIILQLTVLPVQFLGQFLGQSPHQFVREEDHVVLPCYSVQEGPDQCSRISWVFSDPKTPTAAEEIFSLGLIKSRPHRLSVTENCSLVIKNVQAQEAGRYSCQRYDRSGEEASEAPVSLTVITLTERLASLNLQLDCNVSSPLSCETLQVKWINDSIPFPSNILSAHPCGATVVFQPYFSSLRREQFTCEVSHGNRAHQFSFKPEQPEETSPASAATVENSGTTRTSPGLQETELTTATNEAAAGGGGGWWVYVIKSLGWIALIVTPVALFFMCTKDKKKQQKPNGDFAHPPDYENQL